jgi:hypothetical protein
MPALDEDKIKQIKRFFHIFFWDNDDLQLVAIYNLVCDDLVAGIKVRFWQELMNTHFPDFIPSETFSEITTRE